MTSNEFNLKTIKNWQWCAVLLLLILVPVSSKLAGAFWLSLCLLGAWSFQRSSAPGLTSEFYAAKSWLFACLLALTLRAIPQFYWGDSWEERHAEFRLLIGAFGLLALVHYGRFTITQLKLLSYAMVLAIWAGFILVISLGSTMLPTNQIPWAASMSLLVCIALALVLSASSQSLLLRLFYASGVIVGVCAILLSQARGSYGIVFWVCGILLWHSVRSGIKWRSLVGGVLCGVISITIFVQIFPQVISIPAQRIQLAVEQFSAVDRSKTESINTSIGTRIYFWSRACEEIPDHLLMGVGREAGMAFIKRWGDDVNSFAVKELRHLHNNYIHDLFEHGLLGLGSFLAYMGGLVCTVIRLRKNQPDAALGISGILFVHSVSSFTNVNFAHNYYPMNLSIAIFLCFIILTKKFK